MVTTKKFRTMIPDSEKLSKLMGLEMSEQDLGTIERWEAHRSGILSQISKTPTTEPIRWRLDDERKAFTHHFEIGDKKNLREITGVSGYIICGLYDNWQLGEIFIVVNKQGSFVNGMVDALAMIMSISLQHGVPLEAFIKKLKYVSFQPAGIVKGAPTKELKTARSILDYLARWLDSKFENGILVEKERNKCPKF